MAWGRIANVPSRLKQKIVGWVRRERSWKQFELTVTDPPRYGGHFQLIKSELIPYVERHRLCFWVTNYFGPTSDVIKFRVKTTDNELKSVRSFLNYLRRRSFIASWEESTWDPGSDAETRINGLRRIPGFDPNSQSIRYDYSNNAVRFSSGGNIQEKQIQLTALFESLGECTRTLYRRLDRKPDDLWTMSVFIHLLLNSLDFSGPNPPSEEHEIRNIPPL